MRAQVLRRRDPETTAAIIKIFLMVALAACPASAFGQQQCGPTCVPNTGYLWPACGCLTASDLNSAISARTPLSVASPQGIQLTPSVVWYGPPGYPNTVLSLTESVSGTASGQVNWGSGPIAPLNIINVSSDSLQASTANPNTVYGANALDIVHTMANGFTGSRTAINAMLNINATSGNAAIRATGYEPQAYYVGVMSTTNVTANDGGTATLPLGWAYGFGGQTVLHGPNTYYQGVIGAEFDVSVQPGASVLDKLGLDVVLFAGDAVHGSMTDAAIGIDANAGMTWNTGITFGHVYGGGGGGVWPFNSTSTLIAIPPTGLTITSVAHGIDLSAGVFSVDAFRSPGFAIDGAGNVKGAGYSVGATVGVTCTGAPTASFAVTNGIVTHC
jgi:hypothetical protein